MSRPTKAGNKLIFQFQKTDLKGLIEQAVEKIEAEAYEKGRADGLAEQEVLDLDQPVLPPEETA